MSKDETKFIGFRATEEFSEAAKKRAKEQHRSLAGYLRHLLERDLQSGSLKEDATPTNEIAPHARTSSVRYPAGKTKRRE